MEQSKLSGASKYLSALARRGLIGHDWWPADEPAGWPEHLRRLLAYPTPGEVRLVEHGEVDHEDYFAGWIIHTPHGWRLIDVEWIDALSALSTEH